MFLTEWARVWFWLNLALWGKILADGDAKIVRPVLILAVHDNIDVKEEDKERFQRMVCFLGKKLT